MHRFGKAGLTVLRRAPLSRGSGFKRPMRPAPAPTPVRAVERSGVYAPVTDVVVAVPKEIAARTGKRTATVEERRWLDAITAHGCVCCRLDGFPPRPTCVHHILRGGVRLGHLWTLPLCEPGHHQNGAQFGLVSRHPFKARFEERYGKELELLERLRKELGFPCPT